MDNRVPFGLLSVLELLRKLALFLCALQLPGVRHIAIANPAHAPYGRAAEAALHSLGLYDVVKPKLVLGENISQAFEFAQSGAADVGMVALSLAIGFGRGHYWEVPATAYPRLERKRLTNAG